MNTTRINVQAMESESSANKDNIITPEDGGETFQTETVHNLFFDDSDEDQEDMDDLPVEKILDDSDVVVPMSISGDDDSNDDVSVDNVIDNKELFAKLPSFADAARSLHAANTVKKTIRRRLSKRQLSRTVNEATAVDGNDGVGTQQKQKDLEDGEMEIIRSLGAPMVQRKSIRKLNIEQRQHNKLKHKLPCWKLFKLRIAMSWKLFKDKFAEFMVSLQLWRSPLKEVEGNFGNGVLSYFLFLRSLFVLNIIIFLIELLLIVPQALINYDLLKDYYPLVNVSEHPVIPDYTKVSTEVLILDFFTGQGFINTTIMFYSNYHGRIVVGKDKLIYDMPLAYIMVGGAYMIVSFIIMVRNFSDRFTESIMESTDAFQSYCNKVFASWDYCITNDKASVLKKNVIYQDFIGDLDEEKRLEMVQRRTTLDKFKIYMIRICINLLVLGLLGGAVAAIYFSVVLSTQQVDVKVQVADKQTFIAILKRWASSLTISGLNLFLPTLFEVLTNLEQWSPHLTLVISLFRSVLMKLASLIVLIVTLYEKYGDHTCGQCWENQIAAQMFNLIIVDFLVICVVTIFVETSRKYASIYLTCGSLKLGDKIGRPEFQIPKNILDLVYGQSLIWLGTFFAPMMPVLGFLKLFIIFYVKKISLMFNCKSSSKSFQGARSNYFITLLLLLTFLLCTIAIGYGVAQVKTSRCGPYSNKDCSNEKFMINIIGETIKKWPTVISQIVSFVKTAVFIIPVLIITFLILYYYHAMTTAHEKMIELLQGQLKIEGRDKRFLMNRLVEINNNMNIKQK